ncbi:hypothetical protein BCU92_02020 [Vibrio cyclitrophicus]|uniref:hypothetical protein n=1 Tax=Vibrio cyclitrophicus TaxID=47951 RepID=UPI000C821F34|nr:hypothetical protein [Vibrio cyclitrophicus]PMG43094.1 hypothetical protein BCU92_15365 [Vibrio cyclitrophicus]PMK24255.1 hypothetical protein BCU04_12495 [Vibrio cyclitrophicus]
MEHGSKSHFIQLNEQFSKIIEASFLSTKSSEISELFHFVDDLNMWHELIEGKEDTTILVSAIKEYEFSFQAALNGQYRYAFTAQRYFLEQICRYIYLSTNELYLRHWKLGIKDIAWGAIVDKDNGIFSKIYIRAFYNEVEDEGAHMLALASKLYRETSEYIHGNFEKVIDMPDKLGFDNTLLNKWLEFVATSKFIAVFLLTVRFSKEFGESELSKVVDNIKDELGGIEEFNLLCNS